MLQRTISLAFLYIPRYSKEKHVRNGHRSAVSRLLNKFEEIKGDEESFDELARVVAELEKKVSTLMELNDKILEDLQDDEIETEIAETDECMFDLESQSKIHQIQKLVNTKCSVLNTMRLSVASNAFSNSTPSGINTKQHSVQKSGRHDAPPTPLIDIQRVLPTENIDQNPKAFSRPRATSQRVLNSRDCPSSLYSFIFRNLT